MPYIASAWGANYSGQLGFGSSLGPEACSLEQLPCSTAAQRIPGLSGVLGVSAGEEHSLGFTEGGPVLAWGENRFDQLGDGNSGRAQLESATPVAVCERDNCSRKLGGAVAVAAGGRHSLELSAGLIWAWGSNESGQLGDGFAGPYWNRVTPVSVPKLGYVAAVAAGEEDSVALESSNGEVHAWGSNEAGQLGDGLNVVQKPGAGAAVLTSKRPETTLTGVTAIAAGAEHNLALLSNGTVMSWGSNSQGQLGDGMTTGPEICELTSEPCSKLAVPVVGLGGVVKIAAGGNHSLALLSNGTVMAWGDNAFGELGNGSTSSSDVPVSVGGLSGVIAIAAGENFSLALLSNGTVMAWGDNGEGQLGTGTSVGPQSCTTAAGEEPCSTSPVVVAGLRYTDVKGIATGGSHSLAFGPPNPTVTGLSPNSGLVTGGTAVTITGTEFSGATAVHFGSAGATAFVVQSQTTITAVSPSGSGAVDVTVTTPEGTSPTGPADQFTYSLNAPAVAPSTPSSLGVPVSAQRLGTPAQVSNKPTLSHRAVANQATPTQSGAAAVASVTTPRIIGVNIHGFNEFGGEAAIKTILEGPIAPVKSLRVDTPGIAAKAASVRAGATGERQFEQMTCIVGNGLDVGGEAVEDPWRTAELEPPLRTAFEGSKKEQWEVATLKEVKQCAALPVAVIEITNEPWNLYLNGQRLNGYPQEEARFYGEMCLGLLSRVAESQERHELGPVKLLASANQNGGGREWLEAMFTIPEAAKLGEKLGGFAYHPYAKKASEAATSIKEMVRQEEFLHRPQYHVANPIFYVTEYGKVAKGKRKQAAETRRMFEILKQPSRAVQGIWYYDFADPGAPGDGWYPAPGGAIALSKPRPVKCVVEEFAKEEAKETTANGPCP